MLTDGISVMTVSRERGTVKYCDAKKTRGGQFHTVRHAWLKPQVQRFIASAGRVDIVDPFAGNGDIFAALRPLLPEADFVGFDLDPACAWQINDSLKRVPKVDGAMVVTNPPYLAKHSAARKGVLHQVESYYRESGLNDLYLIAMRTCTAAYPRGVFIVPETFLNSGHVFAGIESITVILEDIFNDTDNPVCVVCYDRDHTGAPDVYVGDERIGRYPDIMALRPKPTGAIDIRFNVIGAPVGLRAIDLPSAGKKISFMPAADMEYDTSGIKISSRLMTFVKVAGVSSENVLDYCRRANRILAQLRERSHDAILSPFKGNAKDGTRRRRLDYELARAILEQAHADMHGKLEPIQQNLFAGTL